MKKFIKLFIVIFISFFSTYTTNASTGDFIKQEDLKIKYEGYLNNNTEIKISKVDDKKCKIISIAGEERKYTFTGETITINTKNLGDNFKKGVITLNCNNKTNYITYSFPWIDKIETEINKQHQNTLQIHGENFSKDSQLFIGDKNIKTIIKNQHYMIGFIPEELEDRIIYVKDGDIKSNYKILNFDIPRITYIKSNNGFIYGGNIDVYYKDFEKNKFSYLLINEEKVYLDENYYKNGFIRLDNDYLDIGENKVSIVNNNVISNEITFYIYPKQPIIKKVYQELRENGEKLLIIEGENFIDSENFIININNNKIINNNDDENSDYKIKSINNDKIYIYIDDGLLENGENDIYIKAGSNGKEIESNIFKYINGKEDDEPTIGNIELKGLNSENTKRIFQFSVNYFNKDTDKILVNGSEVDTYIYKNTIKALIDKNKTKGYFSFKRNDKELNYKKYFDISYSKSPIINYINIKGKIEPRTKIQINGKNFYNAEINQSNFLSKRKDNTLEIKKSETNILSKLAKDININNDSYISIKNNGLETSLSFNLSKINSNTINGPLVLDKVTNKRKSPIIRQGDTINIYGSYFHITDKFYLNKQEIKYKLITPYLIEVKLNDNTEPGKYKFKIINNSGIESNLGEYYIFDKNKIANVDFSQKEIESKKIKINPVTQFTTGSLVQEYEIDNKINDIIIKKIVFKTGNKDNLMLGDFSLKLNGEKIDTTTIDKNGNIIFEKTFKIKKDLEKTQILSLEKISPFVKTGKVNIKLKSIEASYLIDSVENIFTNINIENNNDYFEISFSQTDIKNCINNENKLVKCSEIKLDSKNIENKNIKEIKNSINKKISTNSREKLNYIKQLVNSRHKLEKSLKGQKYIKLIDKLTTKYSKNLDNLLKLDKKIKALKNKYKNKNGLKYQNTKNIIDYLDAKISIEIIKQTK